MVGQCAARGAKGCVVSGLAPIGVTLSLPSIGGVIMNTALARRLALGDRVVWIGEKDSEPTGLGTITRITAHAIEVCWDSGVGTRCRRAQLHHLRHANLSFGTVRSEHKAA
jgi:hypothetical protein